MGGGGGGSNPGHRFMVDEPINRMQFWVKRFSFSVDDPVPDLCFDFLMGVGALIWDADLWSMSPSTEIQFWVNDFSFSVDDPVPYLCFDFLMGGGSKCI